MKKSLFLMAMSGLALAGCVNDVAEVAQKQDRVRIAFDSPMTMTNAESRAKYYGEIGDIQYIQGGTTYTYPREEDFQIFAIEHTADYAGGWASTKTVDFNDTPVSFDNNLDGWAPLKPASGTNDRYYYWPSDAKMSFAACSPADMQQAAGSNFSRSYGASGLTLTNFVVQEASATQYKQFDLLFSKRALNCTSDDMLDMAGHYSGIPIVFQHALSSIRFSLDKEGVEQPVYLKEIKLFGVYNKGNFSEGINETPSATAYERGVNVNPAWTPCDGVSLLTEDNAYLAFQGRVEFKSSPQYVKDLIQEETAAGLSHTNTVCNTLLLMPQTLGEYVKQGWKDQNGAALQAQEGAALYVKYEIGGVDRERYVALKGLSGQSVEKQGNVQTVVDKWDVGTRYTYRLVISSETISNDKIYFAPETQQWKEVTAIVVNL